MPKLKRELKLYLEDIKICIDSIEQYTANMTPEEFKKNKMAVDAVVRNIEIIGEAVNNIPEEIKIKFFDVPWHRIVGMRNKVLHEYFGVDLDILWKTVQKRIPELKKQINKIKI